jgi:dynein heavy chain 2
MQQARNAFPRLYFLSDNTLLSLLAWSRNPKDLLPFVKMCFPGIKSLQFALPRDSSLQLTTALDAELNG